MTIKVKNGKSFLIEITNYLLVASCDTRCVQKSNETGAITPLLKNIEISSSSLSAIVPLTTPCSFSIDMPCD